MAGIYLHIPFCKQACHYCDFHFSTNRGNQAAMVTSIVKELELQRNYLHGEGVQSVYFGGGTPSLLEADELSTIMSSLREVFPIESDAEITLEANPEDLTQEKLATLRALGFNRLSIGIQSFDNNVLQFLNRNHSSQQSSEAVLLARDTGFANISIDLIFAIPGQSFHQLEANVEKAINLNPEHISAYSLTVEPGTVFGNWTSKGKLIPASEEVAAEEMKYVSSALIKAGYDHYEISNFCKPGFHSRHNSSYWKQQKYLGVGPGAHSYDGKSRQFNVKHNLAYIRSIEKNVIPFEKEALSREDLVNEYILTTLRTSEGCNIEFIASTFDYDLRKSNKEYLENLSKEGFLVFDDKWVKLTAAGRLVADKISSDLFLGS